MRPRRALLALAVVTAATACAHPACPVPPLGLVASCGGPKPAPAGRRFADPDLGKLDEEDRKAVLALIDETRAVIQSPRFGEVLRGFTEIGTGRGDEETCPCDLLAAYLGKASPGCNGSSAPPSNTGGVVYEPSGIFYPLGCMRETARTTVVPPPTTVVLRNCTRDRARAACACNPEPVSCAVNTMAHEWTHTIVVGTKQLYQDEGHTSYAGEYLASYTVGAVAQCVFLESRGAIRPDAVYACIKAVNTTVFNPSSCEPGWLRKQSWQPLPAPAHCGCASAQPVRQAASSFDARAVQAGAGPPPSVPRKQ